VMKMMTSAINLYLKATNLLGLDDAINLCDFICIMNHLMLHLSCMNVLKFANYVEKKFAPPSFWGLVLRCKIRGANIVS
jgi:hypothetical protein